MKPFDARACALGEGPLWHPDRQELFWVDITGKRILSRAGDTARDWTLAEMPSALALTTDDRLLVATDSRLMLWSPDTGQTDTICPLEPDRPETRSNDGRADPWGGVWISTMGRGAEQGAGAIWRWFDGRLTRLFDKITVPNAICFAPDRSAAFYADSAEGRIWRVALDGATGNPAGPARLWLETSGDGAVPDGAVTDLDGNLWCAFWGGSEVRVFDADARLLKRVALPSAHASCPAFGGPDLTTLFVTSARQGIAQDRLAHEPGHGQTYAVAGLGPGRPEPKVIL